MKKAVYDHGRALFTQYAAVVVLSSVIGKFEVGLSHTSNSERSI
jgi:hypothetical protein